MTKNAECDKTMTTLHLKDMENRVNKNLQQGGVRPKDPMEARILNRFNRK
ncbi:hypothetical protein SAMN04488054_13817 [Salibacterium qingdaonense]|uniref:Uncharacterized protein n=1 Tax=Salibacterium qingdaonense TaxID=266892 RepID=A0A1I4QA70_9BACI|nr:hypothetical protein SAMN04488054_13817 [Salibacterium qingdaonense]